MQNIIKIFYDLETTGANPNKHSLHQIAGIIEINGEEVDEFNILSQPHPKAEYDPSALQVCGKTQEELMNYPPMGLAHLQFTRLLDKYIDKFDKQSKAYLVGFNNAEFDNVFLRAWFLHNKNEFMYSYFYRDCLDVMVLASQYLITRRANMPSFKQHRVATELDIEVDKTKLHDGVYDVGITRQIYRIVTGLEIEL